jgi:hypothetical protein
MGITLVRCHQETCNAQLIWKKYTECMKLSTKAQHDSAKLLSCSTTHKYNYSWKGNTKIYILYWEIKSMNTILIVALRNY